MKWWVWELDGVEDEVSDAARDSGVGGMKGGIGLSGAFGAKGVLGAKVGSGVERAAAADEVVRAAGIGAKEPVGNADSDEVGRGDG